MNLLVIGGAALIAVLGTAHAVFTIQSTPAGGPMAPVDAGVRAAMQLRGGLGLAPEIDSTLWRAWVGFNLSHSLGAVVVAALIGIPAIVDFDGALGRPEWVVAAVVLPLTYLVLSIRYWFDKPTKGLGLASLLIAVGVVAGLLGG